MLNRNEHPDSFKKDAVRRLLARGPKSIDDMAREVGVSKSMLHRWREQFEPELRGVSHVNQSEREEIERLRRELRDAHTVGREVGPAATIDLRGSPRPSQCDSLALRISSEPRSGLGIAQS